jgi:predicted MFS family arabinose efflux permease
MLTQGRVSDYVTSTTTISSCVSSDTQCMAWKWIERRMRMSLSDTALAQPHRQIDLYIGLLTLTFGTVGGLIALPVQFYLKDRLHLGAQTVATFGFLVGIPTYVAFLFGYLRDRWRPRAGGDRAYLLWAGLCSALGYLLLAGPHFTYSQLLVALLILTALGQMIQTAIQAVSTAVAQRDGTTGQVSAIFNLAIAVPGALAAVGGGWLSEHVTPQHTFLLTAGLSGLVALLALWRPRAVYDGLPEQPLLQHSTLQAAARLLRHRPLWPTVLICGLWNFGLCFNTPLQYYLTDRAHMTPALTPEQYGTWIAIFSASFLPTTALYAWVSRHWPLRQSLWFGTALGVFQPMLLLLVHTPLVAYSAAGVAGLFGGFCTAAYFDLLMRSAPKGLEGTAVMLGGAAFAASAAATGVLGAAIYAHGGFALTVWLTMLVYALIFPALLLVPRALTSTHDEQNIDPPAVLEPVGT